MKDLKFLLNDLLNEALINSRIQNPNSNKIAEFVDGYLSKKKKKHE